MPKFMFVYRESSTQPQDVSPEEMQKVFQSWMDWINSATAAGWMVEPGDALKPEVKMVSSGMTITDGPFPESKELVGGYSMVEAADLEAAAKLTEGCPIFEAGGRVEVRELMDVTPAE